MRPPVQAGLTEGDLAAIGLVASNWAFLEGTVDWFIWDLAGIDSIKGRSITTHASFLLRLDMMRTLVQTTFAYNEPEILTIRQLVKRIKWVYSKRNRIVHGEWAISADDPNINYNVSIKARGKLHPDFEKMSSHKIVRIGIVTENLINHLERFHAHCHERIKVMPTPAEQLKKFRRLLREQSG